MIFAASWTLSSRVYGLVQRFCPSNIVLRRVHTRIGIKWGPLAGLAGVVVIGFWNTCRFTFLIPTSVVRLPRVRHQEKVLLRDWQRTHPTDSAPAKTERMDARVPSAQAS